MSIFDLWRHLRHGNIPKGGYANMILLLQSDNWSLVADKVKSSPTPNSQFYNELWTNTWTHRLWTGLESRFGQIVHFQQKYSMLWIMNWFNMNLLKFYTFLLLRNCHRIRRLRRIRPSMKGLLRGLGRFCPKLMRGSRRRGSLEGNPDFWFLKKLKGNRSFSKEGPKWKRLRKKRKNNRIDCKENSLREDLWSTRTGISKMKISKMKKVNWKYDCAQTNF